MNSRIRPASTDRRRLAPRILLVAGSLVFTVLVAEAAIRVFVPVTDCYWYCWDPILGPRLKPEQQGRKIKDRDIRCGYHINAGGWNHPEDYTTVKGKGMRRVCLVGDSQVESLQVDLDKTMFVRAGQLMSRRDRPVQWYTFGCSGWGTNVEYEVIRHYALDYKPDLVILFFMQNDPFDCSPYLVDPGRNWPLYYLGENNDLVLIPPATNWRPRKMVEWASHSALFRLVMFQLQLYDRWHATPELRGGIGGLPLRESAGESSGEIPGVAGLSADERGARTWRLIEKLLEASRDECQRRGARFAVVYRGWMDEIDAPLSGKSIVARPRDEDPYCLISRFSEMGREWVEPICRRLDIPYLDLTDALKARVQQTKHSHVFAEDKHFNAEAHEAAAAAMADWVERIWSATPRT